MYPPSSLLPSGGKGHGTELWRAGPGGMSLIYEYHSINPRGEMSGMAMLWWDAKANGFRELYCTSGGSNGCSMVDAQIRWEGDNLVFTGSFEARGKRMFSREVWSDIKSDFHTMTIADGERVDDLKPFIISDATRERRK